MSVPRVVVPITLDRPRHLVLDINAWCRVEQALGKSILSDHPEIDLASVTALRAVLWAGLSREDPALTLEATGDLITEAGVDVVAETVAAAITRSLPAEPTADAEGAEGNRPGGR